MIGTTGGTKAVRAVTLVVVAVVVAPSLGSVVAAGWQSGTDAVSEIGNGPAEATDRNGPSGSATGERVGDESAKRNGEYNESGRTEGDTDTKTRATDYGGTNRTAVRTGKSTVTESTRRCAISEATVTEPRTDAPATAPTGDRGGGTGGDHAALESILRAIGILGGVTTLFSLGGFVAAVLAYRGTD